MHPHVPDTQVRALPHRLVGGFGSSPDYHGVNSTGNGRQIRIRGVPLYGRGIGIDSEYVIASLPEPLVNDIAAMSFSISGNSRHGDPFRGEELCAAFLMVSMGLTLGP